MAGKGAPKGVRQGGRKKGVPNKATRERIAAAATSGLMPHEFLLAVSRGEIFGGHVPTFAERMTAARDAANYYAAKLSNIEHTGKDGGPIQTKDISDAVRVRALAAFMAKLKT